MKIINEKGKLFGLINIVDLLVLIAAVAVAAGVGYKLFAPQIKESVQPQVELTREINAYNGAHQDATRAFLTAAHDLFMELTGVLNLVQKRDDAVDPDAEKIEELIAQRAAAKKAKDFAEADRIRGVLADMGVTIKDTRQGTQWSRS